MDIMMICDIHCLSFYSLPPKYSPSIPLPLIPKSSLPPPPCVSNNISSCTNKYCTIKEGTHFVVMRWTASEGAYNRLSIKSDVWHYYGN